MGSLRWTPDPEGLVQVVGMLVDGYSGSNTAQESAYRRLTELAQHAEFDLYLSYILTNGTPQEMKVESAIVRQSAGLLLKNNLRRSYKTLPPSSREFVHAELLTAVGDEISTIRSTTSLAVSVIVSEAGLRAWPEVLPALLQYLKSNDPPYVEGAISALCKVCEDSMDKLEMDPDQPLDVIVPVLLEFILHPSLAIRIQVVECFNQLLLLMPSALEKDIEKLVQGLFAVANDKSAQVRRGVCGAICKLIEAKPDVLEPHMKYVVAYMIKMACDPDEELALEATEFWSVYPETKKDQLREHLPEVVHVLLNNIIYDDSDPDVVDSAEDCTVPDRPEDIRPRFHSMKQKGNTVEESDLSGGMEDGDDGSYEASQWNVRKSSAAGLDILSMIFGDELLPLTLPIIQVRLKDTERWPARESAILALGATSEGCSTGMRPYMHQLVPVLLGLTRDPHHLVRSMAFWALSRFSRWIVGEGSVGFPQQTLQALLVGVLDSNKRVQEAACSSLACFEEELGPELVPVLGDVIKVLTMAFHKYQRKNRLILYDAIGTLAECVGHAIAKPEFIDILMPALIDRWNELVDTDIDLLPLFECLTVVLKSLGQKSRPFAAPICGRCMAIVEGAFTKNGTETTTNGDGLDGVEFVICSLDLISGVAEGLGSGVETVLDSPKLLQLLFHAMKEPRADVRQSAFALLGDLASTSLPTLAAVVPEYMPLIGAGLDVRYHNVCNNATWALGEIAVMLHKNGTYSAASFGTSLEPTLMHLIATMQTMHLKRTVLENTAITLGRIGMLTAATLAPALGEFVQPMCRTLRDMSDGIEKEHACRGLCAMIKLNPGAVVPSFLFFCDCIASWYQAKPDLQIEFEIILTGYKNSMGSSWGPYFEGFPEPLHRALVERYHL